MGHLVVEGDQVGQTGPAFHKSMLASSDPLVVLSVLHGGIQEDLLHGLPQHQGQVDRLIVP